MGDFSGKAVLVTGAARGQGRSHAVRFAAAGADVAMLDICGPVDEHVPYPPATPDDLAETTELVTKQGGRAVARQADVRSFDQVKAVVDEALAAFGHIDVVVANAGVYTCDWGWEIPESAWNATIDTNLKGVWNTIRATDPAPYSIRVNTVNPLAVNTPMATGAAAATIIETLMRLRPGSDEPGWVEPDDVSDMVLYLASPEAEGITGIQVPVEPKTAADSPA